MSAFSKVLGASKTRAARRVVPVPPSAFADTYTRKPQGPVKVGLRLISERELVTAQSAAASSAWFDVPEVSDLEARLEAYNENLITNVLAQVCVQADDISKPFFAPAPEALIREALNAGGVRHLWAAYSALAVGDGELAPEATAEEMASLGSVVAEALPALEVGSQVRLRRLARAMLDEIALARVGAVATASAPASASAPVS